MQKHTLQEHLDAKSIPEPNSGCFLWLSAPKDAKGYGRLKWNGKRQDAHRWAWINRHGPIPDGLHVCHKCDVPSCVNPDHMFLGTPQDNMSDMVRKGRHLAGRKVFGAKVRGPSNASAKLTEDQVRAIRQDSRTMKKIGSDYGVCPQTICLIKSRKNWAHVTDG